MHHILDRSVPAPRYTLKGLSGNWSSRGWSTVRWGEARIPRQIYKVKAKKSLRNFPRDSLLRSVSNRSVWLWFFFLEFPSSFNSIEGLCSFSPVTIEVRKASPFRWLDAAEFMDLRPHARLSCHTGGPMKSNLVASCISTHIHTRFWTLVSPRIRSPSKVKMIEADPPRSLAADSALYSARDSGLLLNNLLKRFFDFSHSRPRPYPYRSTECAGCAVLLCCSCAISSELQSDIRKETSPNLKSSQCLTACTALYCVPMCCTGYCTEVCCQVYRLQRKTLGLAAPHHAFRRLSGIAARTSPPVSLSLSLFLLSNFGRLSWLWEETWNYRTAMIVLADPLVGGWTCAGPSSAIVGRAVQ